MRSVLLVLLSLLSTAASPAAVVTFNATGTFDNGRTLGGTLSIDTDTGLVSSADLTISGITEHFTTLASQLTWPPDAPFLTNLHFLNGALTDNILTLLFPPVSLIGYTGGILCGQDIDFACHDAIRPYLSNYATESGGTINPNSIRPLNNGLLSLADVPEPATWMLVVAALLPLAIKSRATHVHSR